MVILVCAAGLAMWVLGLVTGYAAVIVNQQRHLRQLRSLDRTKRRPRWMRRFESKIDREIRQLLSSK